jgi:hypothetical protein
MMSSSGPPTSLLPSSNLAQTRPFLFLSFWSPPGTALLAISVKELLQGAGTLSAVTVGSPKANAAMTLAEATREILIQFRK